MADPIARIRLLNNRSFRGPFEDAAALRALSSHASGDYSLIYSLKQIYKYDAASSAADDSSTVIKPTDVGSGAGRWLANNVLQLDGAGSDPSDTGTTISTYEWTVVSEPSGGVPPSTTILSAGATADLTIPVGSGWTSGGIMVFLRVTDNAARQSPNNPFSPLLNQDALFTFILPTSNFGFLVPAAGVRNWHREYKTTVDLVDEGLADVAAAVPGSTLPTKDDKGKHPGGPTSGDGSLVLGAAISNLPGADSYVRVHVNGEAIELGNGVKTQPCYFSVDGGITARAISDIAAGDDLYWNGVIAGYDLDTLDLIEYDYVTV